MEQSRWKYGNGIRNSSGECWGARVEQHSLQWKLLWCLLGCTGWCWVGFLPATGVCFTRRTWMWVCISKMMLRGNFRYFLWYSWFLLFWICLQSTCTWLNITAVKLVLLGLVRLVYVCQGSVFCLTGYFHRFSPFTKGTLCAAQRSFRVWTWPCANVFNPCCLFVSVAFQLPPAVMELQQCDFHVQSAPDICFILGST